MVASLLILALLLRESDPHAVGQALARVSWGWLALALLVKAAALTLHEIRLWWLLRTSHPCSMPRVLGIGFLAGLINVVLPIRAGDLAAIFLLRQEQRVPGPVALSAVGLLALLEAAALGVFLVFIFGTRLLFWERALGFELVHTAFSTVSIATLVGVGAVLLLGGLGRMVVRREEQVQEAQGFAQRLRAGVGSALAHSGGSLGRPGALVTNLALAMGDAGLFLASYAILVRAMGLSVPSPWTAAGVVMALTAVASLVLPPSLGAGTAAASVFGLGLLGVDEPTAIAFAALVWAVGNLPALILGLPPLLGRLGTLAGLLTGVADAPREPGPPTG